MEYVNVSNVKKEVGRLLKRDLPLLLSFRAVMHSPCQRECHGKANGKKKGMGKD
jgi:hypothetical protein